MSIKQKIQTVILIILICKVVFLLFTVYQLWERIELLHIKIMDHEQILNMASYEQDPPESNIKPQVYQQL